MNNIITAFSEKYKFKSSAYPCFEFPLTMLVYGVPSSGKTYFLYNFLQDIKNKFDEIILYLGAKDAAPKFLELIDPNNKKTAIKILFNYDEKDLNNYYERLEKSQIELVKQNKKPKTILLVWDDIYSFKDLMRTNRQNPSVVEKIFANYRHLNVSCILTSQRYIQTTPTIRQMAKYIVVCGLGQTDIKKMSEEYENTHFTKDDIIESYKKVRQRDDAKGHILIIDRFGNENKTLIYLKPDNSMEYL